MEKQIYDATEAYQSEVLPLLEQLRDVCNKHDLPIFALVAMQSDGKQHQSACLANGDGERMPDSMAVLMGIIEAGGGELLDVVLRGVDKTLTRMGEAMHRAEQRKAVRFN